MCWLADKGCVRDFEFNFVAAANGRVAHKFEFQWNGILNSREEEIKGKWRERFCFSPVLLCLKWVLFQFSFGQIVLLFLRNSILQETRTSLAQFCTLSAPLAIDKKKQFQPKMFSSNMGEKFLWFLFHIFTKFTYSFDKFPNRKYSTIFRLNGHRYQIQKKFLSIPSRAHVPFLPDSNIFRSLMNRTRNILTLFNHQMCVISIIFM